jgi:hypothetical protein
MGGGAHVPGQKREPIPGPVPDLACSAADLGICYNTARVHLYRIFDKAGVRSQGQLLLLLKRLHRAL